jgi:hypothetical protein
LQAAQYTLSHIAYVLGARPEILFGETVEGLRIVLKAIIDCGFGIQVLVLNEVLNGLQELFIFDKELVRSKDRCLVGAQRRLRAFFERLQLQARQ